jgi:hypothetical protein
MNILGGVVSDRRGIVALVLFSVVWACPRSALATTPAYLAQMPSIEQVREDVGGVTELQRVARRTVAYMQLGKIVKDLSKGGEFGNDMTPDERALMERYFAAGMAIRAEGTSKLAPDGKTGPGSMRHRINRAVLHYDNQAFRDQLASKVLPHNEAARYRKIHPGGGGFTGFLLFVGLVAGTVGLLRLYKKLFPRRSDDDDIVAIQHHGFVSGGVAHVTSRPVTRRESLILRRALMFGILVFPLVALLVIVAAVGEYVGVLQPLALMLDQGFGLVVLVAESFFL